MNLTQARAFLIKSFSWALSIKLSIKGKKAQGKVMRMTLKIWDN